MSEKPAPHAVAVGEGWGARLARVGDHRNSSYHRMLFELSVIGKNGKLTRPVRTAAALGSSAHPLSPGTQDISFGVRGGPGEPCVGTPVSGSSLGRCPSQGGVCCRGCARAVWATPPPPPRPSGAAVTAQSHRAFPSSSPGQALSQTTPAIGSYSPLGTNEIPRERVPKAPDASLTSQSLWDPE